MSLTILVREQSLVTIVRWFLEPKGLLLYAGGPIVQMSMEEFRAKGHDWVRRHFEQHANIRVPEGDITKPFGPGEAKKFMINRRVLQIHIDPDKNLIFSPMVVERYSLGDLARVKPVVERTIPVSGPAELFWETFDKALANAPTVGNR